jgi:Mg-chelatase subunit ChlD
VGVEFVKPLLLILIPLGLGALWLLARKGGVRGPKKRLMLLNRALLIALVALALAAPSAVFQTHDSLTWVVVDASDSVRGAENDMKGALEEALKAAPKDIRIGEIAFGRGAQVVSPPSLAREAGSADLSLSGDDSRLSEALLLASSLTPSAGRVAVMSDGLVDDTLEQAELLAARGIPVDVMEFDAPESPDAQLTGLTLPGSLREGQSFQIDLKVDSSFATSATLALYENGKVAATRAVTLRKGENNFSFQQVAGAPGLVTYEARLVAEGDGESRNNRQAAYARVAGRAGVLIVEGRPGEGAELQKMLTAASFEVRSATPARLPETADGLRQYDAVALCNVDAGDLSDAQVSALDEAVRSFGRGLLVTGGDESYALGGYKGSALEKMLPVTMDVKGRLDMPSLALVLVIDKSGSMTEGQYGVTRLELAKEAAMRACEVLTGEDSIGVIAFDDTAKWAVSLQKVEDVQAIQSKIGTIRPGGGTAYSGALSEAYRSLSESDAAQKHVIFLSDGEPGDGGFQQIASAMAQSGITLTSVAIGSGANATLLKELADLGGGRAYVAGEFDSLPKIFTKETYMATGRYVQNRAFTPVVTGKNSMTSFDGFPPLNGYLSTTARPLAAVSLASDTDEPVLADWRYGAGRVAAWTSDAAGAWTDSFLAWDQAAAFFGGLASYVLPTDRQEGTLTAQIADGALRLRYEPEDGASGQKISAGVLTPGGEEKSVPLPEAAPGVYEAELPAPDQGAYAATVSRVENGQAARVAEGGAVVAWPKEYDQRLRQERGKLAALARMTGGRVVTDAAQLLAARSQPARTRRDLSGALALMALILFLLDVALNRLPWERALENARASASARRRAVKQIGQAKPEKTKPSAAAPDTASQLLSARKTRKRL